MAEVILESLFSILGAFFEFLIWPLFYYSGWMILKVITLGKYPSSNATIDGDNSGFVKLLGITFWLLIIYIYIARH